MACIIDPWFPTASTTECAPSPFNYERLEVVFDTGLTIFTYTADPGTRSAEALGLLGSLAATTRRTSRFSRRITTGPRVM
jgi:hypothetical protein